MEISRTSPVMTLLDSSKGSMGNRLECAGEKFIQRAKYLAPVSLIGGVAGATIAIKPSIATKVAKSVGTGISKLLNKLPDTLKNSKILSKIAKHPVAAGAIAIGTGVIGVVSHLAEKLSYKEGRIDQKYEDRAKLEALAV